jgi:hypothetical protein
MKGPGLEHREPMMKGDIAKFDRRANTSMNSPYDILACDGNLAGETGKIDKGNQLRKTR